MEVCEVGFKEMRTEQEKLRITRHRKFVKKRMTNKGKNVNTK